MAVSCGVGCRCGWDPALLWLWRRPAHVALIRPLAWEPLYAAGAALKRQRTKEKKKKKGTPNTVLFPRARSLKPHKNTRSKRCHPERGTARSDIPSLYIHTLLFCKTHCPLNPNLLTCPAVGWGPGKTIPPGSYIHTPKQ